MYKAQKIQLNQRKSGNYVCRGDKKVNALFKLIILLVLRDYKKFEFVMSLIISIKKGRLIKYIEYCYIRKWY